MAISLSDATVYQYYRKWEGRTFVVQLADAASDSDTIAEGVLKSLSVLMKHGVDCVLVHGDDARLCQKRGLTLWRAHRNTGKNDVPGEGQTPFLTEPRLGTSVSTHPETHLPITSKEAIPEIRQDIRRISHKIAAKCNDLEIQHEILPQQTVSAERLLGHGETGRVTEIRSHDIQAVTAQHKLAILSCGGISAAGSFLNVIGDMVASETARALGAQKLILLTDSDGIRVSGRDNGKRLNFVDFHGLVRLIRERDDHGNFVIGGGMLPTIEACLRAVGGGVGQVHIIKATGNSILQEVLTRTGIGTLVEYEQVVRVLFPATEQQIEDIVAIRQECSSAKTPGGVPYLKPLTRARLAELIGTTLCLQHRGMTVGTMYFHPLPWDKTVAVIGGLAVGDNHQDSGYGQAMLEACLEKIWEAGFSLAFSLTAAEGVKSLFRRYASGDLPPTATRYIEASKERYGEERNLVEAFLFQCPNS